MADHNYTSPQSSEIFATARAAEGIFWTQPFRDYNQSSETFQSAPILSFDQTYAPYFVGFSLEADGCQVYSDSGLTAKVAGVFSFESPAAGIPKVICFKPANSGILQLYLRYKIYTGSTKVGKQALDPAEKETEEANEVLGKNNINVSSYNNTLIGTDNQLYTFTPFPDDISSAPKISIYININPNSDFTLWTIADISTDVIKSSRRGPYPLSYCDITTSAVELYRVPVPAPGSPAPTVADFQLVGTVILMDRTQTELRPADITYAPGMELPPAPSQENGGISIAYNYVLKAQQLLGISSIKYDLENLYNGDARYGYSALVGSNNKIISKDAVAIGHDNKAANIKNTVLGISNDIDGVENITSGIENVLRGCFNKVTGSGNHIYSSNTNVIGNTNTVDFNFSSLDGLRSEVTSRFDLSRLNWGVIDEEAHQEGTLLATPRIERCEISSGIINFSVNYHTVLNCSLTDVNHNGGGNMNIGSYGILIYELTPSGGRGSLVSAVCIYEPSGGGIFAYHINNSIKGALLSDGTYEVHYYYSSSIVPQNTTTNLLGNSNLVISPIAAGNYNLNDDYAYSNVFGNNNITSTYSNNIFGNMNQIGGRSRNMLINNNYIFGKTNLIYDYNISQLKNSLISGQSNQISSVRFKNAFLIDNLYLAGNGNVFMNGNVTNDPNYNPPCFEISNFTCIGSANIFGRVNESTPAPIYTLSKSSLFGHDNQLKFSNHAEVEGLTICGNTNLIDNSDNVSLIYGNENQATTSLVIDFNTVAPVPRTFGTEIIGHSNEILNTVTNSTIFGNENRLMSIESNIIGSRNWIGVSNGRGYDIVYGCDNKLDGNSNILIGCDNYCEGLLSNAIGTNHTLKDASYVYTYGCYNQITGSNENNCNGVYNTINASGYINCEGYNNIINSCDDISCSGTNNIIYTLPPFGLENTTDVDIILTIEDEYFVLVGFDVGRQLGLYPLSYCNLSVDCDLYYRTTETPQKILFGTVTLTDETAGSFPLPTSSVLDNLVDGFIYVQYFLRVKQYTEKSAIKNNFISCIVTYDNNTANFLIENVILDNVDFSTNPILTIFNKVIAQYGQYVIENFTSSSTSFPAPAEFIYSEENSENYCFNLSFKSLEADITNYDKSNVNGSYNNILALGNIIAGNDNKCSSSYNIINGSLNIVECFDNAITGNMNNVKSAMNHINGDQNYVFSGRSFINGSKNIIENCDLMLRYQNIADKIKTDSIANYAVNAYTNCFSQSYYSPSSLINTFPNLIQSPTLLKLCTEICTVTYNIVYTSKPIEQICNTFINSILEDNNWSYDVTNCTIKVINYEGPTVPYFWRTDTELKTNLPDGNYTLQYYYLPAPSVNSFANIQGSNNMICNKYLLNSNNTYTLITGDNNKTYPNVSIYGRNNQNDFMYCKIFGNNNVLAAFLPDITDDPIWGYSRDIQILGDENDLSIIYENSDNNNFLSQYNNTRNATNIIGNANNYIISGFSNVSEYINVIGFENDGSLMTTNNFSLSKINVFGNNNNHATNNDTATAVDNVLIAHTNIIGSSNNIYPQSDNTISTVNIFGHNNTIKSDNNLANFDNATIIGSSNQITLTANTATVRDEYKNCLLFGFQNNMNLSPGNKNVLCFADNENIVNCSNVAIIGQTTYAKADLSNTVIMPGTTITGAEHVNVDYSTIDGTSLIEGNGGFIYINIEIGNDARKVFKKVTLKPDIPPPNPSLSPSSIINIILPISRTGRNIETFLEIENIEKLSGIVISQTDSATITYKRVSGRIFENVTDGNITIPPGMFMNSKITFTKLDVETWLIEH